MTQTHVTDKTLNTKKFVIDLWYKSKLKPGKSKMVISFFCMSDAMTNARLSTVHME